MSVFMRDVDMIVRLNMDVVYWGFVGCHLMG